LPPLVHLREDPETGSEVAVALKARKLLAERDVSARVVSMPSWEIFDRQDEEYRESVLPPSVKVRVSVEAGVSRGWRDYVGDGGASVSIERFGASAPGETVLTELGLTPENVASKALELLGGPAGVGVKSGTPAFEETAAEEGHS
jgi:transketolase